MTVVLPYDETLKEEVKSLIRQFRIETAQLKAKTVNPSDAAVEEELMDYINNGYSIFVARCDEACCGFLVMRCLEEVWWVDTLFVSMDFRRRGVASDLYERAEQHSSGSGPDNLFVWVHPNNHKMLSFLKSRGYDVLNLIEVRKPWRNEHFSRTYSFDEDELRY